MFEAEARWVGERLAALPAAQLSPLLNIGSSTKDFRENVQPWTVREIFMPLSNRGLEVVHLDSRSGSGIDLRADLLDDADFARLRSRNYGGILCCNVLEHVRDPLEFARRCEALVKPGGIILVTVPHSYPHHADPIDTLYRPTPDEIAGLFADSTVVAAAIIDVGRSYRDDVGRRPWILLRHALRLPFPFLGLEKWRRSMQKPYWLFHNYRVSAVLARRDEDAQPATVGVDQAGNV
jgi:SAM-dependent methyltransferase